MFIDICEMKDGKVVEMGYRIEPALRVGGIGSYLELEDILHTVEFLLKSVVMTTVSKLGSNWA